MTKLYIDNGTVRCPRRGDLDIDYCVGCPDLRDIRSVGDHEVMICTGRSRNSLLDRPVMSGF